MQRNTLLAIASVGILVSLCAAAFPWQRNSFQAHMRVRTAQSGYLNTIEGDVYYSLDGRMVTFYEKPQEYTMITNSKGEVQVYDPKKHTVYQQASPLFSTENSQLYFFLQNRQFDLGLTRMGFTNTNTTFEEGLMVSEWTPPLEMSEAIQKIKMVHEGPNPIYLEYLGVDGDVKKKVYFYDYQSVGNQQFPQAMTQVDYFPDQDSLLTKTEFTNFQMDEAVDQERLSFTVPADAKLILKE